MGYCVMFKEQGEGTYFFSVKGNLERREQFIFKSYISSCLVPVQLFR